MYTYLSKEGLLTSYWTSSQHPDSAASSFRICLSCRLCLLRGAPAGWTHFRVHPQAVSAAGCSCRLYPLQSASTGCACCRVLPQAGPTAGCSHRLCLPQGVPASCVYYRVLLQAVPVAKVSCPLQFPVSSLHRCWSLINTYTSERCLSSFSQRTRPVTNKGNDFHFKK